MTARLKHLVDYARCIQPIRRMRQFHEEKDMPVDAEGRIDWNRLQAHGERLWIASTECGLGFSGTGDFPHLWLRHGYGWSEPPDDDAGWCKTCLGEKWGIKPQNREYAEPNLRAEFDAWTEAIERKKL